MADALPEQIVESIAISNAKSIGEQPAILSNLALANQILNNNMQQQMMLSQQQAMNQLTMATLAKCVFLITKSGTGNPDESQEIKNSVAALKELLDALKKAGGNPGQPGGGGPHENPGTGAV
jgi:hypothetical protein